MMMLIFSMVSMFILFMKLKKKYVLLIYSVYLYWFMFICLFKYSFNNLNYWIFIYKFFGMDFYSWGLIMLMIWIMLMVLMISNCFINLFYIYYLILLNLLIFTLYLCFVSMNFLLFYMMFEFSLMPLFLMILGWGYQIDRINAGFYMLIYTIFGSLPLMFMLINFYLNYGTLIFLLLNFKVNFFFFFMCMLAFLIKMPLYFVHLWLPKAHVEAPVIGSMILAGIMLKLGSYGMLRLLKILNIFMSKLDSLIIYSLLGGIISSMICIYQIDMKLLVAYSSVVHMNLLISGLFIQSNWGIFGSYLMMLSHGLGSSGLFALVGFMYNRTKSRSLMLNKGMINIYPSLSLMWFLLFSVNISFPPSLNLFSEILLLNCLIIYNKMLFFLLIIYCFLSVLYMIYLYSYSQHGKFLMIFYNLNLNINELLMLLFHWFPLNLFFIYMFMYM